MLVPEVLLVVGVIYTFSLLYHLFYSVFLTFSKLDDDVTALKDTSFDGFAPSSQDLAALLAPSPSAMNTLQYSESQLLDTSFPASTASLHRGATMNGTENGDGADGSPPEHTKTYSSDFFHRLFNRGKKTAGPPVGLASAEDISPDTSVHVIKPTRGGLRETDDWYTNARSLPRSAYGYRKGFYLFSLLLFSHSKS